MRKMIVLVLFVLAACTQAPKVADAAGPKLGALFIAPLVGAGLDLRPGTLIGVCADGRQVIVPTPCR